MATDYASIRVDNERRYGTDIGRIGPMLLADRYDDRTHFIFELLQNAEDALARRKHWTGSRAVRFTLLPTELRIAHFGRPFDCSDVRSICGIAENTKDLIAIGRFGIGFKSVYAFTPRPEVHSGGEDFAIESFVWPTAIPVLDHLADETVFVLPLRSGDKMAHSEIAEGLRRLGPRTLLFLRQIEEIAWNVDGGLSGIYVRSKPEEIGNNVHRIVLLGEERGKSDVEEAWLLFSRAAKTPDGSVAGRVEIAFSVTQEKTTGRWSVQAISDSPLVVFFPTVLQTYLGFLVQGPYRTTPSRDNVSRSDPWNQHLVSDSATLLVEALRWLRDNDMLDVTALNCLPLDRTRFEESMFAPLFDATLTALASEPLLPRFGGGYVPSSKARLARTKELRALFGHNQLAGLLGQSGDLAWLGEDITQDRTPDLRQYLLRELSIQELAPETLLPRLNGPFLQAQSDDWILALYEFLSGQPGLLRRLEGLPLIRIKDGTHVPAHSNGQLQAFLPSSIETGFPTVHNAVCSTPPARQFLESLGLTQPDPVDDVVRNVLPRYCTDQVDVSDADYESDIRRITAAFNTDSKGQREKLLVALRETAFVMAVDASNRSKCLCGPNDVYLATERLKNLFADVEGVLLVDDSYACLRGEDAREMLEACGAVRYLRPIEDSTLPWKELASRREQAGHAETSGINDRITDWNLQGLEELLELLPSLDFTQGRERARLLWEELANLEERRGKSVFSGEYTWTHYGNYRSVFDAAFVRQLKNAAWVPDIVGNMQCPDLVLFDTLGWKQDPFLLSKIPFRPPIIDQLAREAGIEPGLIDLLKRLGVTSEADLRARLGVKEDNDTSYDGSADSVTDALKKLLVDAAVPSPPVSEPGSQDPTTSGCGKRGVGRGTGSGSGDECGTGCEGHGNGVCKGRGSQWAKRTPGGTGGRPFVSYVGIHHEDEGPDPDGLDQAARMALEAQAIDLILAREPRWRRTPTHNPGFDLYQGDELVSVTHWCEVKAMTGSLDDRPVGMSNKQFEWAREHGETYWMYVVERAGTIDARIIRIQDPAGKARTFTFDHGWIDVAKIDPDTEERED